MSAPSSAMMPPGRTSPWPYQHALERLGPPEEVAGLVGRLASGTASVVTGAYYAVRGGYLAR